MVEHTLNPLPEDFKVIAREVPIPPPASDPSPELQAGFDVTILHELADRPLTDVGNAERLALLYGDKIRYCSNLGWMVYNGKRWLLDGDNGELGRLAVTTIRTLQKAIRYASANDSDALRKHARASESKARINSMIELARAGQTLKPLVVSADTFDADPDLLNVQNGTVDLRTGMLREHSAADLLTRISPATYDPDAHSDAWNDFQLQVADGDIDLVSYKQRVSGYAATGHASEQVLILAFGNGANGKSTEIETIAHVLGDYTTSIPVSTLIGQDENRAQSQRNQLARLPGARLVRTSEPDAGALLSESTVKAITGGEIITAEHKYKDPFTFQPQFTLFLATNHLPAIQGTDEGIWRRLVVIPYDMNLPVQDRNHRLKQTLITEHTEAILNWLVQGAVQWYTHGLGERPKSVTQALTQYRSTSDSAWAFLKTRVRKESNATAPAGELYKTYKTWCESTGARYVSIKEFQKRLLNQGFEQKRTSTGMHWLGISLGQD